MRKELTIHAEKPKIFVLITSEFGDILHFLIHQALLSPEEYCLISV